MAAKFSACHCLIPAGLLLGVISGCGSAVPESAPAAATVPDRHALAGTPPSSPPPAISSTGETGTTAITGSIEPRRADVPQPQHEAGAVTADKLSRDRLNATSKSVQGSTTRKTPLTSFPRFSEVAHEIGLEFTYTNGATGRVLMVEATGGGAGWLDYDGDGLLDLHLCQGGNPASEQLAQEPVDQLFRQIEPGRFVSVTLSSGVLEQRYSQGVAVADFDDDGFDDLYVTNVGANTLFHNQGDGTFVDVTAASGTAGSRWSSSAAWGDLDADGDLDLYVCNYVNYDPYHPIPCGTKERPGTCHPMHVDGVPDDCFFNQGDGTFLEQASARGLYGPDNKALGVAIADFNVDGLPDVYVANDTTPNFLFMNQGHGQFQEQAHHLGCAVNRDGHPQASMGVALGDYDQNGLLDLYCTHFTKESNTLYRNLGSTGFQDVTGLVGLHLPTLKYLGFGTVMTDFNQDGHEDIFVTNGHVDDWRTKGDLHEMEPQLFSFEGPRFVECSREAGEFFSRKLLGRGVARGDYDHDGDWDLAVVHQNAPLAILRNDSERGHWFKLRCQAIGNRRGIGTRVVLKQGGRTLTQELAGGTSYCAAHEAALIFGLAADSEPVELEIRWPDGSKQTLAGLAVDQQVVLRQPLVPVPEPQAAQPPRPSQGTAAVLVARRELSLRAAPLPTETSAKGSRTP